MLCLGEGKVGAQSDRSELQGLFSSFLEYTGRIWFGVFLARSSRNNIHSFIHSVIINSTNRFLESHLHKKETI